MMARTRACVGPLVELQQRVLWNSTKRIPGGEFHKMSTFPVTEGSLERVLAFTTSVTYDIKAYSDAGCDTWGGP
jgi:hypothetical protein